MDVSENVLFDMMNVQWSSRRIDEFKSSVVTSIYFYFVKSRKTF